MKKILFILTCLTSFYSFSQFEIKVENLTSNSQPVNYCSTIDLGTSASSSISLLVNCKKPHAQVVGTSDLDIYIIGASGYRISKFHAIVFENQWFQGDTNNPDTFSQYFNFTISASEINVSGGILFCVLKSYTNIEYQTACNYPIIKTPIPSFTISPTNISIACGDTSARTFTITPANIPSGANVTYQWSYNGWTTVSSTSTSKTLQPTPGTSGTSLPSGISVIPSINGLAQPTLSCVVSRAAFSSAASIAGNTTICIGNNGIYSISGLGAGNTVSWSSSNTAIATVSGGTQSQVTVNGSSQGLVNLIATVTNACGQTAAPIIKPLNIGAPVMANGVIYGELWVRKNFFPQTLTFPAVLGATTYTWSVAASLDFPLICPIRGAISPKFSNDLQTITTTTPSAIATFGSCLGEYYVNCTVSNACGSSVAYTRFVTVGVSGTSPCDTNTSWSKAFTLSQNPIKNGEIKINKTSNLVIDNSPFEDDTSDPSIVDGDSPCYQEWPKIYNGKSNLNGNKSTNNSQIEVKIFDFYGKMVFSKIREIENEEISIKDTNLKPGQYIIHINNGSSSQKEIIIIE